MGQRLVGDVAAVHTNCLSIKEVGKRLIGRIGVTQGTCSENEASIKVFRELAFEAEPNPQTGAVAVQTCGATLKDAVAPQPHIAGKPKPLRHSFQHRYPLLLSFFDSDALANLGPHAANITGELRHRGLLVVGGRLHGIRLLLRRRSSGLCLLELLLDILPALAFLFQLLLQVLNLPLLRCQHVSLRRQCLTQCLQIFGCHARGLWLCLGFRRGLRYGGYRQGNCNQETHKCLHGASS